MGSQIPRCVHTGNWDPILCHFNTTEEMHLRFPSFCGSNNFLLESANRRWFLNVSPPYLKFLILHKNLCNFWTLHNSLKNLLNKSNFCKLQSKQLAFNNLLNKYYHFVFCFVIVSTTIQHQIHCIPSLSIVISLWSDSFINIFLVFFVKIDTFANLNAEFSQHIVNKCWLKCWPMKSSWCEDHFQYFWFSHRTNSYFYILHWKWKCWNPRFQHFHFFWKTELRRYWIGRKG